MCYFRKKIEEENRRLKERLRKTRQKSISILN